MFATEKMKGSCTHHTFPNILCVQSEEGEHSGIMTEHCVSRILLCCWNGMCTNYLWRKRYLLWQQEDSHSCAYLFQNPTNSTVISCHDIPHKDSTKTNRITWNNEYDYLPAYDGCSVQDVCVIFHVILWQYSNILVFSHPIIPFTIVSSLRYTIVLNLSPTTENSSFPFVTLGTVTIHTWHTHTYNIYKD